MLAGRFKGHSHESYKRRTEACQGIRCPWVSMQMRNSSASDAYDITQQACSMLLGTARHNATEEEQPRKLLSAPSALSVLRASGSSSSALPMMPRPSRSQDTAAPAVAIAPCGQAHPSQTRALPNTLTAYVGPPSEAAQETLQLVQQPEGRSTEAR